MIERAGKRFVGVALSLLVALSAGAHAQSEEWGKALAEVEPVILKDADMKRLIKTVRELQDAGVEGFRDEETTTPQSLSILTTDGEALGILKKIGFKPESFSSTMMNVVLAMGAMAMEDNKAEMEAAMAQLEAMKTQLPPEQYEMLKTQMFGVQAAFAKAPAENIPLVRKYQEELEALGE